MPFIYAIYFFAAFAACAVLTRLLASLLAARGILDHANERSSHVTPTPRGGGVAILAVVLPAFAFFFWPPEGQVLLVLTATAMLAGISWFDDLHELPGSARFAAQALAVILCVMTIPADETVFSGVLPLWADRALTALAWLWFVNLYNFMDGIDGLAGGETLTIGLGLAVLALQMALPDSIAPLGLVLAGAAAGFLVWNWQPARIFLGDVGSAPLGFLIGWLLIVLALNGGLAAAIILPLYFLVDATLTLLWRLVRGERIWQAHATHFYQRAVRGGASHARVTLHVVAANAVLVGLAFLSLSHPFVALCGAVAVVALLLLWMQHRAKGGD